MPVVLNVPGKIPAITGTPSLSNTEASATSGGKTITCTVSIDSFDPKANTVTLKITGTPNAIGAGGGAAAVVYEKITL